MKRVKVSELMSRDVQSIDRSLGVDIALEIMGNKRIRRLPVVSESGRLIGIITREDARTALEKSRANLVPQPPPSVDDAMTHVVHTATPEESIAHAGMIMVKQRVGALPVVADDRVVGIITESDIFKYLASHLDMED